MSRLRSVVLVVFAFLLASAAYAQQASIVGTAMDESKAVLPGVNVTATDQAAGRTLTAVTNEKGQYLLQNIPPGKYTVQAELSGFQTVMFKDIELLVGQNATVPFTLKLASVTETLTVIGETPLVDTTSAQVAGNVDRRQMEQLPLQGRNWMELSKLVKGVTANDVGNSIGTGAMDDLWQLNLDGQQITIGRANDATLVLTDDYASTRHARLFPQDGQWIVEDLGSTNGTYLDRQKVTQPVAVPVGVPIRLITSSADVIHSWAMPAFWMKLDAVPGRLNETSFTIEKPGLTEDNEIRLVGHYIGQDGRKHNLSDAWFKLRRHELLSSK